MADLTQVRRSVVRPTALFGQTNYRKKGTWCVALIFTMYLGEFPKLRKVTISFTWINSAPTARIFVVFDI
jgi:hypothetical protein